MKTGEAIRKGQRYRAREESEVLYNTSWSAPFTGGGMGTIPAGTILIVDHDPVVGATGVSLVPEAYGAIEEILVPRDERTNPKYGDYRVILTFEELDRLCDLVPS